MKRLNPIEGNGVTRIDELRGGENYHVYMNGHKFDLNEPCCEDKADFDASMGTPSQRAYSERRDAYCEHQIAVLDAKDIQECENCENCDSYLLYEIPRRDNHGTTIFSEYRCSKCDNYRET